MHLNGYLGVRNQVTRPQATQNTRGGVFPVRFATAFVLSRKRGFKHFAEFNERIITQVGLIGESVISGKK